MHHHYQNLVTQDISGIIIDTASYANYVVTYISNPLTTSLPVIYNVFARFNYKTLHTYTKSRFPDTLHV